MKKFLLLFLLIAPWNLTSAQTKIFLDDSLVTQIKITQDPRLKVDCLNRLGFLVLDGGNRMKSLELFRQADSISRKINYKIGILYGEFYQGLLAWDAGDFTKAEEQLIRSLKTMDAAGVRFDLYSPLSSIRFFFNDTKQYEKKLKFYQDKLLYYQEYGPPENIGSCYHGIANYSFMSGNVEKAIEYYSKAGENWKSWGNESSAISIDIVVALIYKDWGNLDYARKQMDKFERASFSKMPFVDYINYKRQRAEIEIIEQNLSKALSLYFELDAMRLQMGEVNLTINFIEIAKTYLLLDNADNAKIFLDLAAARIDEKNYSVWRANGDMEYDFCLSNYYKKIGKNDLAIAKLKEALVAVKREKYNKLILKYLNELSVFSSSMGLNADAYRYITERNHLRDSLEKTSQSTRVAIYETEQKEQQITLLNKDKEIQQTEIEKQKLLRNSFLGGFSVVLLFAGIFLSQRNKIKIGKKRSDELLLNILPSEVAEELKAKGSADAKLFDDVTVMFTDFKNFTQISEKLSPAKLVAEIHTCFKAFDNIISKHNIEKIKTIGDAYMCVGGLPVVNTTHATNVVNAAIEIQQFMRQYLEQGKNEGKDVFEIRIGIHTGPVVAGIVGVRKFAYDIWGDTVNIASRMESSGEAGKINISGSTYELVKEKFNCIHRGKIQAKNKGEIDMYFVNRSPGIG